MHSHHVAHTPLACRSYPRYGQRRYAASLSRLHTSTWGFPQQLRELQFMSAGNNSFRRGVVAEVKRKFGSGISNFVNTCPYSFTYNAIWISRQTCLLCYNAVDISNFPSRLLSYIRYDRWWAITIWGTRVLMMSLLKFKMLKVRVKLSLSMPRRHTGEQRCDELIDCFNRTGWCKRTCMWYKHRNPCWNFPASHENHEFGSKCV
jgi:hypothetical protein